MLGAVVPRRGEAPKRNPLFPARLFGIMATWREGDVIEATVNNAFTQGCERVFLVDKRARTTVSSGRAAAEAKIARVYHTDYYFDKIRVAEVNRIVNAVSSEVARDDRCTRRTVTPGSTG